MKRVQVLHSFILAVLLVSALRLHAQGTVFTYQGQLQTNGVTASGVFDMAFKLFADSGGISQVGSTFTIPGVGVTNGLFLVQLDFGNSFPGAARWLQIGVRTNGSAGAFTTLNPLQPVLPTPYAIMAANASNLVGVLPTAQLNGTLLNSQLANSSVTINAGAGLSGGGTVALGGSTALTNTGVLSVTGGGSDITANTTGGVVTLGSDATTAATPATLAKRDASGGLGASNLTLFGGLTLPAPAHVFSSNSVGGSALLLNADQQGNFFAGLSTGNLTLSGIFNTAVGNAALINDTTGNNNLALGVSALFENTNGSFNTAVGNKALFNSTNGVNNIALGFQAGTNITSGSSNIYIGASGSGDESNVIRIGSSQPQAFIGNTRLVAGTNSGLFIGTNAGNLAMTGTQNLGMGQSALSVDTTGADNAAFGFQALVLNTTGSANTAVGDGAMTKSTTGDNNTAVGILAMTDNIGGLQNSALGANALLNNTFGSNNTAMGYQAMFGNRFGSQNTAIGQGALSGNQSGNDNIAIGASALSGVGGNDNIGIGSNALGNTAGQGDIGIGNLAGDNLLTGSSNIYIGSPGGGVSENNTIRIGTPGIQTSTVIAGTISGDGGGLTNLNAAKLTGGALPVINGANLTSLTAGNLTGALPAISGANLTSLPANAALLNATQTFTSANTFTNSGAVNSLNVFGNRTGGQPNPVASFENKSPATSGNSPALRVVTDNAANDGALSVSVNVAGGTANSILAEFGNSSSFVTVITNDGSIYSSGNLIAAGAQLVGGGSSTVTMSGANGGITASNITINNSLVVDSANLNVGLNQSAVNAGVVFGSGSGEGITSVRAGGFGDSFGLNFYTDFAKRLTILQNGNIGIGTTNATSPLTVAGNVAATSFTGDGSGLANTVTAANYVYAFDTTTQPIAAASTAQDVTFNNNAQITGWTHTTGTANFICGQNGLYLVQYSAVSLVTSGTGTFCIISPVLNGSQINGMVAWDVTTGAGFTTVSQSFIASFHSGDSLKFEQFSNTTPAELVALNSRSISCTIVRIQ